jgi:hypothetical protein
MFLSIPFASRNVFSTYSDSVSSVLPVSLNNIADHTTPICLTLETDRKTEGLNWRALPVFPMRLSRPSLLSRTQPIQAWDPIPLRRVGESSTQFFRKSC